MSDKPVFLLGVGAQKAGTTWLYHYLRSHPQCAMGRNKELATLELIFGTQNSRTRRKRHMTMLRDRLNEALDAMEPGSAQQRVKPGVLLALLDQVTLDLDPKRYMAYFRQQLDSHPGARLVGDITPAYAAFDAQAFRDIRALIVEAGFAPRVVFLMRDPVERCYSALRMGNRRAEASGERTEFRAHENFAEKAMQPWCVARTRYDQTVAALEAGFEPDELFIDLFERFISRERVRALTDRLGLDFVEPEVARARNVSPRKAEPDADEIRKVRAFYEPVYAFARDRFGEAAINALWKWA